MMSGEEFLSYLKCLQREKSINPYSAKFERSLGVSVGLALGLKEGERLSSQEVTERITGHPAWGLLSLSQKTWIRSLIGPVFQALDIIESY